MKRDKFLNKARLLFRHDGHESHAVLLIGEICLHGNCFGAIDLSPQKINIEDDGSFWIYLHLYEGEMGLYHPKEEDPLLGSLKPNWSNGNMIGHLSFKYGVCARRPDSMTRSTWSQVDYHEPVIVEGIGKIQGFDEDDLPVVVSCGLYFSVGLADEVTFQPKERDEVYFKGYLQVWAA